MMQQKTASHLIGLRICRYAIVAQMKTLTFVKTESKNMQCLFQKSVSKLDSLTSDFFSLLDKKHLLCSSEQVSNSLVNIVGLLYS